MSDIKPKRYTYFIGIDVSKNELDYAVMHGKNFLFHKEDKNESISIVAFIEELKKLPSFVMTKAVFCMENTGIYGNHLLNSLKKFKANIVCENALKIKNSLGLIRNKNDKIDSMRIAQYAYMHREGLNLFIPKRTLIIQLASLSTLRSRLLGVQVALKTPLKEQTEFTKKGLHAQNIRLSKSTTDALINDIKEIDIAIDKLIDDDESLKRLMQLITSVQNIGRITAIQIIISTNEFRDINNPKKFACYAGVAPFKNESGKILSRAKVSNIANKKMKALLHTCAMGAISRKGELQDYYFRKTKIEGKPKMAAINAVRNKLILRVFACVNQNRPYEKDYVKPFKEQMESAEVSFTK